jgi:hypothetical protein
VSVKSKGVSLLVTVIVAAAALTAVNFIRPGVNNRGPDDQAVTFTGIWTDSPRAFDGVHIQITVGGSLKYDKVLQTAPIQKIYPAQRGDNVEIRLRLTGAGLSKLLGCSIRVGGFEAVNEHIPKQYNPIPTLKAGDNVRCWTTVG